MAEGGVLGKLGFAEEAEEAVDSDSVATPPEPVAAAMAAEAARNDPELSAAASDYFRQQSRFIEIQTEHLHEQRTLNLRHLRVRRWRETLQLGVQLAVVIAAGVIVAALLVMVHDAFTSRQVVIESFDAPAALTARGLTGKVVASGVLDGLTRLQEASRLADHRPLTEAWTKEIQIDVPETGISLGELDRAIKARFGKDIHITGDLVQADNGRLLLTVRGDGVSPRTFAGPAGGLDALTNKAAEYLFGQAEPVDYANFLANAGRNAEGVAFVRGAYAASPPAAKPQLLVAWGNSLSGLGGSMRDVLALYREALTLKPDYWAAYADAMNAAWALGDEEGAWKLGEAMRRVAHGRPGRAPEVFYQNWDALAWNLQAWRKALQTDEDHVMGESSVANAPAIADIDLRLHDDADAMLQLQTVPQRSQGPDYPRDDPLHPGSPGERTGRCRKGGWGDGGFRRRLRQPRSREPISGIRLLGRAGRGSRRPSRQGRRYAELRRSLRRLPAFSRRWSRRAR